MIYKIFWTLKRGNIDPPEEVDVTEQLENERKYAEALAERYPFFTKSQLMQELGVRPNQLWELRA